MRLSWSPKGSDFQKFSRYLYIYLSILAILSFIGLDYIQWKNGEHSYIFSGISHREKEKIEEKDLNHLVLSQILEFGVSPDAITHYIDDRNIHHVMLELPLRQYQQLAPLLEMSLEKANATIRHKEQEQDEKKIYNLWTVRGEKEQNLSILFSCQKVPIYPKETVISYKAKNKVSIIIDDMGYNLRAINELCSLEKPLTIAILPYSPLAKETAYIAHQNNLEVLLHLPMESVNNTEENNHMDGIIHSKMTQDEIIQIVEQSIQQVPYIHGVNNHMGSKITANETFMRIILECIKKKNLFFIDSRTTNHSVAYNLAQSLKIPSTYRHVFLDSEVNKDSIRAKLIELFQLAQKTGAAVGIGHPLDETLSVLKNNLHLLERYNCEAVYASQVVQ